MEQKISAKLPLNTALLFLEQLSFITHVYSAKIKVRHIEAGCDNCKTRVIKKIKKALSNCCPELLDEEATVEVVVAGNKTVEEILQAFHSPKLGCVVATQ